MERKQFPAETTPGEAGAFSALVSTYETDRQGERVIPGAFRDSLKRWRESGKLIPVLTDHQGEIERVVGGVDPRLSAETEQGLEVSGSLDLSTDLGRRVYELVKAGTLSWSIGFTIPPGGRRRRKGVVELREIDLAEISAVPVPANEGVRTLAVKSATPIRIARFEA